MGSRLVDRKGGPELGASYVVLESWMLSVFNEKLFDVLKTERNKMSWLTG